MNVNLGGRGVILHETLFADAGVLPDSMLIYQGSMDPRVEYRFVLDILELGFEVMELMAGAVGSTTSIGETVVVVMLLYPGGAPVAFAGTMFLGVLAAIGRVRLAGFAIELGQRVVLDCSSIGGMVDAVPTIGSSHFGRSMGTLQVDDDSGDQDGSIWCGR